MAEQKTRERRTIVDPKRHEGAESSAKGDPTGLDFDDVMKRRAVNDPVGFLARVFDAFLSTASPKEKPNVIQLSDDENAHRIMSNAAIAKLAESVDRLITDLPKRVEIAPSDRIAFARSVVGLGNPATVLVGRQADRMRLRIRNREASDGNSIFLGTDPGLTTGTGFEVPGGTTIEIDTRAALYAVAETAAVTVDIIFEFVDLKS